MYRKLSLSIYRFLLRKLSIIDKITGFQPKVNMFLKNSIFLKRNFWKNCLVGPTSIEQLSIVNSSMNSHEKK
jgi:hypothetical protein